MSRKLSFHLLLAFFACAVSYGATFVVPTDREMIRRADVIVVGSALTSYTQLTESGRIETVTPISVEEVLKGRIGDSVIDLHEPGGRYGERITFIPGTPQFTPGQRVLLMLSRTPQHDWVVTELTLGKFAFGLDRAGRRVVYRQEDELVGWDLDGSSHREPRRSAERFLDYIRNFAAGREAGPDYFVPVSPLARVGSNSLKPAANVFTSNSYTIDLDRTGTGKGGRWNVFPNAVNWTNTNILSNAPNNGIAAIEAGLAGWRNDCGSNVNYQYNGQDATKTNGLAGAPDGANTIIFERDLTFAGITGSFNCATGGVVAIGGITSAVTPLNQVNGEDFWTTVEGDVEVRMGLNACTAFVTSTDLNTAFTHELGHTLGFRHSDKNRLDSAACSSPLDCSGSAIMTATLLNGINGALQPWDVSAVRAVYPGLCSVAGDFNGDTKVDILLRNYATGQNAVWLMNGTNLQSIVDLPALTNLNWRIEGTADFNGDGNTDILLRNYSTGQNAIWLMSGASLLSIVDLPALPNTNYHFQGTGDFNGDGKPDIILRNYSTGQNALWIMNGTAFSSIVDLPALPNTAYHIESTGDFDNDGKTDIVLRNYTTGQNALWLMSGTTLLSIVDLPALPNTAYHIEGVADFNGDFKPDIILRNFSTGQNAVWIMNGTSLSTIVDLPALPNTNYEINGPR